MVDRNRILNRKNGILRAFVPPEMRDHLIDRFHELLGHPGVKSMCRTLALLFYWPLGISLSVIEAISGCESCARCKVKRTPKFGPNGNNSSKSSV